MSEPSKGWSTRNVVIVIVVIVVVAALLIVGFVVVREIISETAVRIFSSLGGAEVARPAG